MGLRSKELKKLELRLEILDFLKEYGIEPNDLHYLHEAVEYVKKQKENKKDEVVDKLTSSDNKPIVLDEKTKEEIKQRYNGKMTPDEFISQFAGESEEFYPYGKPKKDNN